MQYWGKFLSNVDKQNLLFIMGQSNIGLDSLTSLNKRTNVKLISVCGNIRTGGDGTATITLRFNAGTSGTLLFTMPKWTSLYTKKYANSAKQSYYTN